MSGGLAILTAPTAVSHIIIKLCVERLDRIHRVGYNKEKINKSENYNNKRVRNLDEIKMNGPNMSQRRPKQCYAALMYTEKKEIISIKRGSMTPRTMCNEIMRGRRQKCQERTNGRLGHNLTHASLSSPPLTHASLSPLWPAVRRLVGWVWCVVR